MKVPDQTEFWNAKHQKQADVGYRSTPSLFAQAVEPKLPKGASIIDFGCGVGADAIQFAKAGFSVLATDFSDAVIEQNKALSPLKNLKFMVVDMAGLLPFEDASIDVVYSYLTMHCLAPTASEQFVRESWRILKPGGVLAIANKSIKDPEYGHGEQVAPNYFVTEKGHARHLFTMDYTRQLVEGWFDIELIEETPETYTGKPAMVIRCIVKKPVHTPKKVSKNYA